MGTGLSTKKAQIAVKEESSEGTAESVAAGDAKMELYDLSYSPGFESFTRDPARTSLSQLDPIVGKQAASISWRTPLVGSGGVTVVPNWDASIRACGFAKSTVSSIAIGAVSGGPFEPGETITGGTSSGTGRVVGEVRTGASVVPYVVLTGTLQSGEVLTGGTSGATATSSGAPSADQGWEYRPASSSIISVTAAGFEDGLKKVIYGARGNVRLEANVGEPAFLAFDFQGVYGGVTDVALLSITYLTPVPIAFLNVAGSVHGLAAIYTQLSIDMGNTLAERESANKSTGILSTKITDRAPTGSINPEMELVADADFYGELLAGTAGRLYSELPSSTAGEKITVAAPRVLYTGVGEGDRNSLRVAQLDLSLVTAGVSAGDDELQIGMY